ncbi:SAM pointed domain-containing Ets transcription factor-like [Gigantopelta aegis]|uniref:SAM pointed domain-containing Ets transcription factor-like n=1 Tax=Gigantopelta aegis TaxID=1735272 RepID=UPI001B88B76F|nr:SAM pointed domain-containing Ets transcription factor-like [Gigantopelta aegis]
MKPAVYKHITHGLHSFTTERSTMSAGFDLVQKYLRLCEQVNEGDADTVMLPDPQQQLIEKILASGSPDASFLVEAIRSFETVVPLPPFDLMEELSGPQTFSGFDLVPDEETKSSESSDLLDLDQVNTELTFYDERYVRECDSHIKVEGSRFQSEGSGLLEHVNWTTMTSELIKQMRDIEADCRALSISMDPMKWTTDDVSKWITRKCIKNNITDINLDLFHMSGVELCQMSEVNFRCRCPTRGSELFSELEVWKNAWSLNEIQVARVKPLPQPVVYDTSRSPSPECNTGPSPSPGDYTSSSQSSGCGSVYSMPLSPPSPSSPPLKCIKQENGVTETLPHIHHKQTIHLWQFLKELLLKPESFSHCIKWLDRSRGIFKIEDSGKVAKEWGMRKNRPAMNYDKLSRSIRQYYKKGIIRKTEHSKRLVYQFCQPYL